MTGTGWPDPATIVHHYVEDDNGQKHRCYRSLTNDFQLKPGVTTVLDMTGFGKEGLIRWASNLERQSMIQAATAVYQMVLAKSEEGMLEAVEFRQAIEDFAGKTREHQKQKDRAAAIGKGIHEHAEWRLRRELGLDVPEPPKASEAEALGAMAFDEMMERSGLRTVATEQPIWHPEYGYSGTIDWICECPKRGLGIRDLKTSKGIWENYHLQLMGYVEAARAHGHDIRWADFVRLPKSLDDPMVQRGQYMEIVELGAVRHYNSRSRRFKDRSFDWPRLLRGLLGATELWHSFYGHLLSQGREDDSDRAA